jgi:hypothetical protein
MKPDYQVKEFHRDIAKKLEAVAKGEIKYLAISLPPRSGKSKLAAINFPTRCLGLNPYLKFVVSGYGQELVNEFSREAKAMIQSPKHKALFGLDLKEW